MSQATTFNQQLNSKTTKVASLPLMPLTFPLLFVLLGLISGLPSAKAADGQRFSIPAQSLNNALMEFAASSKLEVVFNADMVRGYTTAPVNGSMTSQQALGQLLNGTGITYRYLDAHTVTLTKPATKHLPAAEPVKATRPLPESSDTTLPKVTVEANAEYDAEYYADPYNKDYVIPNATAGTKTDTPVMETPLNVQVISKQVLKDRQVIRLGDAFKNVSGVTTITNNASPGGGSFSGTKQTIFLRGFDSQTFLRNGFRLQEGAASRELANVESVEVLKGTAAILYGQVEPGGMINIVTKQPLMTPYYGFTQQFGSYDLYRTTFDASGPLNKNKNVVYRANLSYENSGTFRDFVDREDVFFAPVLRWNITPQTQITFEMEYNHLHQGLDGGGFRPNIPGIPKSLNYGGYSPSTTETIFGGFNWSHQFNDEWVLKHRFSVNQSSTSTPLFRQGYIAGDKAAIQAYNGGVGVEPIIDALPNGSYVGLAGYGNSTQYNTYSNNLDLVGHFDTVGLKHTLLLGGDYYRLDTSSRDGFSGLSYISLRNPVQPGIPVLETPELFKSPTSTTDQYGLYIQDQIELPYDLYVTGGIRYQYIDQNHDKNDAVTPRVGILWHPKSWVSLYANYAEGFGANQGKVFVSNGVGKSIAPTSAEQYEGGIKFSFLEDKLRANFAYYDLTKSNVAVGDPNPLHNCGTGFFVPGQGSDCSIALGGVRSRGPEIDIQGEIVPGWNIIATWANQDIIVTKTNANGEPFFSNGIFSYTPGDRLLNQPRNTGSFWSTYEVQSGDFKGFNFGGGVTLRDSQLVLELSETKRPKLPGYATVDLVAGYSRQIGDAKVSVQFNIDNLLDKQYSSNSFNCKPCGGNFVDFGTPRTFMGQVSVQY
ncbi:MAG: TonB-dependent receptor [Methyloglobulus sp.]|nr:TonB-dependent receptor [Methyloglobulus sp.]